jgi:hypothetical protein
MRVENQTNTRVWKDWNLCPETSTKKALLKFYLRTHNLFDFGDLCVCMWQMIVGGGGGGYSK